VCRYRHYCAIVAAAVLLLALPGATAQAQCVTNPPTPYTNIGTIQCVTFNDGATHTGDVTNRPDRSDHRVDYHQRHKFYECH
jgi:hypothetical protein